jgi:imidazoleglycerol phosphate synthase glutamine amidotransferase subunit HisH
MAFDESKKIIGIQFHPENSTINGKIFFKKWINYIGNSIKLTYK